MSAEELGAGYGRSLAAGILLLMLAACAGTPSASPAKATASADQHTVAERSGPRQRTGAGPLPAPQRAAQAFEPAARRAVPAAASLPPQPVPLIGMNVIQVVRVLGRPMRLRRDPPAEVWQYANPRCVLFLFFYQGRGSKEWRVQYVEGRDRQTVGLVTAGDCLKEQLGRPGSSIDAW